MFGRRYSRQRAMASTLRARHALVIVFALLHASLVLSQSTLTNKIVTATLVAPSGSATTTATYTEGATDDESLRISRLVKMYSSASTAFLPTTHPRSSSTRSPHATPASAAA